MEVAWNFGDTIEVEKNGSWVKAVIVGLNLDDKHYLVGTGTSEVAKISFDAADKKIRKHTSHYEEVFKQLEDLGANYCATEPDLEKLSQQVEKIAETLLEQGTVNQIDAFMLFGKMVLLSNLRSPQQFLPFWSKVTSTLEMLSEKTTKMEEKVFLLCASFKWRTVVADRAAVDAALDKLEKLYYDSKAELPAQHPLLAVLVIEIIHLLTLSSYTDVTKYRKLLQDHTTTMEKSDANIHYYQWDSFSQHHYLQQYLHLADAQDAAPQPKAGGSPPSPTKRLTGAQLHLLDVASVDAEKISEVITQLTEQTPVSVEPVTGVAIRFKDVDQEGAAIAKIKQNNLCGALVNGTKSKILLGVESIVPQ
eukprot:TRINITY_DN94406_c0_g1_i1.p1 TRINITY_DN94406_c0_g1~~TRINITY_DN94406_c0_g1_i1.p1  ORF type:complete len:363 (-),score=45.65 TRINITY_DN94406_c0_g1_i1:237-1325(-)